MSRISLYLLAILSLYQMVAISPTFAGQPDQQYSKKVTLPVNSEAVQSNSVTAKVTSSAPLESPGLLEICRSWFDYIANNVTGRTMAHSINGIHFALPKQPDQFSTRYLIYDFWDYSQNMFLGNQTIGQQQSANWGRIINGKFDEALIAFAQNGLWIYQGPPIDTYTQLTSGGSFPGIARQGDAVTVMGQLGIGSWLSGDTVLFSVDYMSTWTGHHIIPQDPLTADVGMSELWPTFNPTDASDMTFSYIFGPDVSARTSDGSDYVATTSDGGTTYSKELIWMDDSITTANSQYIIENFNQGNSMYSQDGNYHVVFGAVQGLADVATSTQIDIFPILYWNTRDRQMMELTDVLHGRPADPVVQSALLNMRPGNGLGNAYPQISEGPNGELVVIWQQWEDDGNGGIVTQTGQGGFEVFMTDIYGAYSADGGQSWSQPFFVAGSPNESDIYPNITSDFFLNATNDSIILDMMYMWDTNPGTSLFAGGNDPSECIWYYERVPIALADIVGISQSSQSAGLADQFMLYQNYPNPFNPTTTIRYMLTKSSNISLIVYDVTGRKIVALEEGQKVAGEHLLRFNATGLPSGIYFYQLKVGYYKQTRKMIIMK
jgi:hypothetical protein